MVDWSDALNFALGALSLAPFVLGYLYHKLPSYLFRVLDDTLKQTETLLSSSMEEALIVDHNLALKYMQSAEQLRTEAERMRPRVYRATTYWLELKSMFAGLSMEIMKLSDEVLVLRSEVSETISSSRERLREEAELAPPQEGTGTVTNEDDASASVSSGNSHTLMSRLCSLVRAHANGPPSSQITLVDFSPQNEESRLESEDAETAHTCCRVGNGPACGPYTSSSRPRVITRSYSTPSLSMSFDGWNIVYDRPEPPTTHPGPSVSSPSSSDTPSVPSCPSDMPSCEAGAIRDVVVVESPVSAHRCSR